MEKLMKRLHWYQLAFVVVTVTIAAMASHTTRKITKPVTVYLPDANQATATLCVSNRTHTTVIIPHGVAIKAGHAVNASVVRDFQWEFGTPYPATDRADVDCFVVSQ
jgi:hypothetical protein